MYILHEILISFTNETMKYELNTSVVILVPHQHIIFAHTYVSYCKVYVYATL